ncbi:MAG TPA: hypothetical protein VF921_18445 [Vicinamibacterales bacterium]
MTRLLTRVVRALSRRSLAAWRVGPGERAAANVKTELKSAHQELQAILKDPIMQTPRVTKLFMAQLIDQPSP